MVGLEITAQSFVLFNIVYIEERNDEGMCADGKRSTIWESVRCEQIDRFHARCDIGLFEAFEGPKRMLQ